MGSQGLDANQDALAATLQPMYGSSSSVAWAHYNDENTPDNKRRSAEDEADVETTAKRPSGSRGGSTDGHTKVLPAVSLPQQSPRPW